VREDPQFANQLMVAVEDRGALPKGFALSQSVLDHAPVGMVITSADDVVIWANLAMDDFLGISRVQLVSGSFLPFVHAHDRRLLEEDGTRLLEGQTIPDVREFRWRDGDDRTRWGSVRTSIAIADSGEPLLYGESARPCVIRQILDITEKKAAEKELARVLAELRERNVELERSNEELMQFAYVASHDLSEPLRVIAGHVELLARRYEGQLDENADRYIAFAVDGCTRMRVIIEDLLTYSRAGREVKFGPVDMADVMEQVRRNLAPAMAESRGTLHVDGLLPTLVVDGTQFVQVLTNLVANSLKYARPDLAPVVHLRADHDESTWRIEVADNGVGIPEEHHERIFRIFQRLHGRDVPGTGIGLAICRKVVERHHGSIEVGQSPYGGAAFTIVLPDRERGADG
jgi:PAS domain S-box-containing protein